MFVIAYDMLTQARIALGVRFLRRHAPKSQVGGTALADCAPTYGAVAGLLLGLVLPAPGFVDTFVAALGIVMAAFGALLVGVAWPKRWIGTPQLAMAVKGLALHLTLVSAVLALASLVIDLPGAVWILALGPIPTSVVSFARLYGYSPRTAATGLALSVLVAIALLPISLTLAA